MPEEYEFQNIFTVAVKFIEKLLNKYAMYNLIIYKHK